MFFGMSIEQTGSNPTFEDLLAAQADSGAEIDAEDELAGMLAEMSGADAAELQRKIVDAVTVLLADLGRDVNLACVPGPPGRGPQPVQLLDLGQAALTWLRGLADKQDLVIPLPQAGAVMCFHDAYPQFWPRLTNRISGFKFNSSKADEYGGGLFDDDTICISNLSSTLPGAYVRLVVHEIGHAAFEAVLLNNKKMPLVLAKDAVQSLQDPPSGAGSLTEREGECWTIQRYWNTMSPAAKIFYQSWRVLRVQNGHYLLGTDLGLTPKSEHISVVKRQKYQADSFGEFCAESFMLFAMGDLHDHVVTLLADNAVGDNVKRAWRNAWWILSMIAEPILGGRDF